jgi:hypothetical protein
MNLYQENLKVFFEQYKTLTKKDLWSFYISLDGKQSEQGFFWYLYELQQANIIKTIDKESYFLIKDKPHFSPKIDSFLEEICKNLLAKLPLSTYCIWSSSWLSEFTVHQSMKSFISLEVEKEAAEAVFYALKDMNFPNVFLILTKKDELLIERYVFESYQPIVVSKIVTKSPVKRANSYLIYPKLEKILVDLFCDESLLVAYKGNEQNTIFRNALQRYVINLQTMFAYAKRRKKEEILKNYLYENFKPELESILL